MLIEIGALMHLKAQEPVYTGLAKCVWPIEQLIVTNCTLGGSVFENTSRVCL